MKEKISCPCGKIIQIDIQDEYNLDKEPEHLEKIANGSFLCFKCPDCAKMHKPEFKIKIVWKSKNINMEVLPELERGEFYRKKKEYKHGETIISYPEMADRLAVIKDDLEPIVIETLKSFLLAKAEEAYPNKEINAWYHCKGADGIEFHLDGIREDEVAVMRVPLSVYAKTLEDFKKHPKNEIFSGLRFLSYLSVQNMFRSSLYK